METRLPNTDSACDATTLLHGVSSQHYATERIAAPRRRRRGEDREIDHYDVRAADDRQLPSRFGEITI